MKLKDSLYKIASSNTEDKSFNLELIPDCLIYLVHFPEQPITPGVCIIQITSELLNEISGCNYELINVSNAKFLAVINPIETKSVNYTFKKVIEDKDLKTARVSVIVSNSEIIFAKLSLVYKKQ